MQFPRDFIDKNIYGDAVEIMKKIPDSSIDLVITSPPYNLKNSTSNGMKDRRGSKWANAALMSFRQTITGAAPSDRGFMVKIDGNEQRTQSSMWTLTLELATTTRQNFA